MTQVQEGEQKGRQEGRQEGIREGVQKGLEEGRKAVACSMLQENISVDTIMRCTGLSIDEIVQLQTKH